MSDQQEKYTSTVHSLYSFKKPGDEDQTVLETGQKHALKFNVYDAAEKNLNFAEINTKINEMSHYKFYNSGWFSHFEIAWSNFQKKDKFQENPDNLLPWMYYKRATWDKMCRAMV